MRRNAALVATTVSAVMLGAGWAAGLIGAAVNANQGGLSADVLAGGGGVAGPTTSPSTTAPTSGTSAPESDGASTSPGATATPEPVPAGVSGTFDGALVNTKEGPFQAEIVVSNNTITAVNVLVSGDSRRDSVDINSYALPALQERVLTAQSWQVQGISGASYTVQGFLTSVKDAMAQAGLA